jgi:hypothetical protein
VRRLLVAAGIVLVTAGCGNFFPNPDNVVLPSGSPAYELLCGGLPRAECEAKARAIVATARREHPNKEVTKIQLVADGGYTVEFADGYAEQLVVN